MFLLKQYSAEIHRLCVRNKVSSLYAFGCVLNEHFNNDSDANSIVDFPLLMFLAMLTITLF